MVDWWLIGVGWGRRLVVSTCLGGGWPLFLSRVEAAHYIFGLSHVNFAQLLSKLEVVVEVVYQVEGGT